MENENKNSCEVQHISKIYKVQRDIDMQLIEYDVLINLPDGVYKYNAKTIKTSDMMSFFKQRNKYTMPKKTTILLLKIE